MTARLPSEKQGMLDLTLTDRPEWFSISFQAFERSLAGVPGVQVDQKAARRRQKRMLIHITHLPLLKVPDELLKKVEVLPPKPCGWLVDGKPCGTFTGGVKLRPHQIVGRDFILRRSGTLLADTMRTGKSPTVVASHELTDGQLVVVAPLSTRVVWLSWMKKRWPDIAPVVVNGRTYDPVVLASSPLVFMHYDIMMSHQNIGRHIGTLVFDEAHLLSNYKAARARAAAVLATGADRVICATGTPIWNRPADIYNLLGILNTREPWGDFRAFSYRYGAGRSGAYGWVSRGTSHEEEFQQRLSEVMIRRTWDDVQADLPPIQRSVEVVTLDVDEMLVLDRAAESSRSGGASRVVAGELAHYRKVLGKQKVATAVELVARFQDAGEPVVVWVWHKEVAAAIAAQLDATLVTGDIPQDERDRRLDRWRLEPSRTLVITLAVGQAGIDLSHACHAVFAETDWTPAVISQAEMRTFSPDRPMSVTYLVSEHPIERMVISTVLKKVRLAEKLGVPCADTELEVLKEAADIDAAAAVEDFWLEEDDSWNN